MDWEVANRQGSREISGVSEANLMDSTLRGGLLALLTLCDLDMINVPKCFSVEGLFLSCQYF